MGLLSEGSPLSWEETKKHADHVRKHGIKQFVNLYRRLVHRTKDVLYWGDEVEYQVVKFDHANKRAHLLLCGVDLLHKLQETEQQHPDNHPTTWRPEYGAYMVEGTPGRPYGGLMAHFNIVEANMKLRRQELERLVGEDAAPIALAVFPRLGCPDFTDPPTKPTPQSGYSRSLFFPDDAIFGGHPRFKTLTKNIRERRKEKVIINVPVFKDKNTLSPFVEDYSVLGDDGEASRAALPDHIYMDCMGFGMGNCCLQVTFQACNIAEARYLYDQLTPLCPILLALSAASPIFRGYLSDIDTRWMVIAASVDDRTREERGLEPLKENRFLINKSRYDSIDSYLSPEGEPFNDIDLVYDKEIYEELIAAGVDKLLAQHLAHLFIRDPISLFQEKLQQNDEVDTDHFENIQSTNWQTMRFKPPPPNSNIGWRVEFRPMEVQLSDFENAAFVTFIVLMTRVILSYKLNFLIPISRVDENLRTAHKRDAARTGKFFFRKDLITDCSPPEAAACMASCSKLTELCEPQDCGNFAYMTADEIVNGTEDFPGLIPLIHQYLEASEVDVDTNCTIQQYLKLISKRASGELLTTASWIRQFVMNHPDYNHDSVVSDAINYDLLTKCTAISRGEERAPDLLFQVVSKSSDTIPQATSKAEQYLNSQADTGPSKTSSCVDNS